MTHQGIQYGLTLASRVPGFLSNRNHTSNIVRASFEILICKCLRALITGSSRGIGRAAAEALMTRGATVAINGRRKDSTEAGIEALGGGELLVAVPGDVSTAAGCDKIVTSAADRMDGIEILVNSAGVAAMSPLEGCTEPMRDSILNTNLKGTFFAVVPRRPTCVRLGEILSTSPAMQRYLERSGSLSTVLPRRAS